MLPLAVCLFARAMVLTAMLAALLLTCTMCDDVFVLTIRLCVLGFLTSMGLATMSLLLAKVTALAAPTLTALGLGNVPVLVTVRCRDFVLVLPAPAMAKAVVVLVVGVSSMVSVIRTLGVWMDS